MQVKQYSSFKPVERAAAHPIIAHKTVVNFFEGALLGNGGLGAVVVTRPDAVVIHFGHNNVWDIRVAEDNKDKIGTFKEIFERVKAIPETYQTLEQDPWFADYVRTMAQNYGKIYPRPFPCGSLILGFDHRRAEIVGHRLDISNGICDVQFLVDGQPAILQIFVDLTADRVWLQMKGNLDDAAVPVLPFERIRLLPDPEKTPGLLVALENNNLDMEARAALNLPPVEVLTGSPSDSLSFRQVLPYQEPQIYDPQLGHPKDRAFRLSVRVNGTLKDGRRVNWHDQQVALPPLEKLLEPSSTFRACIQLDEGLSSQLSATMPELPLPTEEQITARAAESRDLWADYWNKSGVKLDDPFLERIWYWNLYFLNCATRPDVNCPGLFANWSYRNIGSAWHGDYHMNYNTQQPFWVTFASNHLEKHLPYVDLVDRLRPLSRQWACEYYGLRGTFFPHSAYPVDMTIMPYPVPIWGWEICETPWTVQSLWWHYLYTIDREFLRQRAFEPIKEAVLFLVDYSFMAPMGIWFENFALPVVINECLLQSYAGTLRFFPNWPPDKAAEFRTLRAAGAFLVSAAMIQGKVAWIEILSEVGMPLRALLPWTTGARCIRASGEVLLDGQELTLETHPGEVLYLMPKPTSST